MKNLTYYQKRSALWLILGLLAITAIGALAGKAGSDAPALPRTAQSAANQLDGRMFTVQLIQSGRPAMADSLIFQTGKFESTACRSFGFGKGTYSTKKLGSLVSFESKTVSPKEGIMLWKGTIQGNRIQGTVEQSKYGQDKPVQYTFSGTMNSEHASTGATPR